MGPKEELMFETIHVSLLRSAGCAATLTLLLAACSGETVDLGELSKDLSASAPRCQEASLVAGSVVIENQAQLDQLEGCEEIEGNFYVRPFVDPDFRPLAALRRVGGALELGRRTVFDMPELPLDRQQETLERETALLVGGWLASLEGFENLERAGSLSLSGVGVPNLAALSNLTTLSNGGSLQIELCTSLRDLTGLERLTGVVELRLNCHSLESLAGPRFSARMSSAIIGGPRLVDLGNFAPESVHDLAIKNTGLEHLDALSKLTRASGIELIGNAALTNIDALDALEAVSYLGIMENPRLERLPELAALFELDELRIVENDSLENLPSLPALGNDPREWDNRYPGDVLAVRPDLILVNLNPALESLVIPAGWPAVSHLMIGSNAGLVNVDLSNLRAADGLYISENPLLETVSLGLLETVDDLRVVGNPLLSLEPFDELQTFRRIVQPGPLDPSQD
jgi:hypothetical protein